MADNLCTIRWWKSSICRKDIRNIGLFRQRNGESKKTLSKLSRGAVRKTLPHHDDKRQ